MVKICYVWFTILCSVAHHILNNEAWWYKHTHTKQQQEQHIALHRHWHGDGHHIESLSISSHAWLLFSLASSVHMPLGVYAAARAAKHGGATHAHVWQHLWKFIFVLNATINPSLSPPRLCTARRGTAPIVSSCSSAKGNHCHFLYTSVSKARYVTYVHAYRSVVNRPTKKVRFLEPSHILGYDFTHSILFF